MAFATLPAALVQQVPFYSGNMFTQPNPTLYTNLFTFDAATDVLALVTRAPYTGTLTEMLFRTGLVTTAGATFDMGLYTVDASGLPTTTPYATNSNGTVVVGTGDDNAWMAVSINSGTGVSVTRGDLLAIVLSVSSGTPNVVPIAGAAIPFMQIGNFPYQVQNTTGSLAKVNTTSAVPFVWNYGGTYVYADGCSCTTGGSLVTIGNGAERGLRFSLPVPMRVSGFKIAIGNMAAGADYEVRLYGGSAPYTTLASFTSIDGDVSPSTTADGLYNFPLATSVELTANTEYFLAVKQTTANALTTVEWTVASSAYLAAMPGGAEFYLANRDATAVTNNTAFTETDTTVPMLYLSLDGLDDGTGGGGGGGLRLAGHGGLAA